MIAGRRLGALAVALGLAFQATSAVLGGCDDEPNAGATRLDAATEGGPVGASSSSSGLICDTESCDGPDYRNPYGCPPDAGTPCVQIADDSGAEAGPYTPVFNGCLPENECYGDTFACGGSTDCTGAQRCCAATDGRRIQARCKDVCAASEVQICDSDGGCAEGTACVLYPCSKSARHNLRACEKPAICE